MAGVTEKSNRRVISILRGRPETIREFYSAATCKQAVPEQIDAEAPIVFKDVKMEKLSLDRKTNYTSLRHLHLRLVPPYQLHQF